MPRCRFCGRDTKGYDCSKCDETYCSKHNLPENHDCTAVDRVLVVGPHRLPNRGKFDEPAIVDTVATTRAPKRPSPSSANSTSAPESLLLFSLFVVVLVSKSVWQHRYKLTAGVMMAAAIALII